LPQIRRQARLPACRLIQAEQAADQAAPQSLARDKQGVQIAQLGREANDQANDQTAVHTGGYLRTEPGQGSLGSVIGSAVGVPPD
jgi:hypothetical protein